MAPHATYPFTGRLVIRLTPGVTERIVDLAQPHGFAVTDLTEVACGLHVVELAQLCQVLGEYPELRSAAVAATVSLDRLLALEETASHSPYPPLHSLASYWILDPRALAWQRREELFQRLLSLSSEHGVERVYREPELREPAWAVDPSDDSYASKQEHLLGGTTGPDQYKGINVNNAAIWGQYDGGGVGFVDLERGWNLTHEDLPAAVFPCFNTNIYDPADPSTGDHGTAVLGVVVGVDNQKGIIGIAPGATLRRVVSRVTAAGDEWDLVNPILEAIKVLVPGDVLLLEVETVKDRPIRGCPVEIVDLWFDAIRLAVGNGIVVVEPAGNGYTKDGSEFARNLDKLEDDWSNAPAWRSLDRASAKFADSGAILVSACASAVAPAGCHRRLPLASFGSRVDCYAWGEDVYTAGKGDYPPGQSPGPPDTWYTDRFSGTSSASAIIAGAALLVQDMSQTARGFRLAPAQLRALLADPSGVPILDAVGSSAIGVMPDLVAVAGKLGAVPDLFIRDSVTDAGAVPSGFVSMSPDIIVRQASVPNAAVEFGEPGPWVNAMPPIDAVRAGQPNYLYARLRNRSLVDAAGATVTLFWSEPSPLVAPVHWNLIGALGGILVPAGGALTVAGPLVWTPAAGQLPASGHGCFVAMVEHPLDPAPPLLPGTATWDDFLAYIGRNNNAAWRNFTVLQPSATESGWAAEAAFVLRGAGDDAREFMIEVVQRVSPGIRIWWDVPPALATLIRRSSRSDGVELDQDEPRGERRLRLRPWRRIGLGPLPLAADTVYRCTLHVAIARAPRTGPDEIVVRQLWREREVGRLTWRIGEGG